MKLRYSAASPYVRKVLAVAIEAGLDGRIERIPTDTNDKASGLAGDNPLGKVPALTTDEGERLYDSPVICEYLDSLNQGRKLFPAAGPARWTALRRQALADGILDAGILIRYENGRPAGERSPGWIERQIGKINGGLDALEAEAGTLGSEPTIGELAIGCCLGWLDFRKPAGDWREGRPRLASWYATFAQRPSLTATVPKG